MHWPVCTVLALSWIAYSSAILVNVTFDDTDAAWAWSSGWHAITRENPCADCAAQPDGNRPYNHSWHDGSLDSGSFTFQGVAVYIFGVDISNPAQFTFAMSNPSISSSHFKDTGGGYLYDSLFFSAKDLDGAQRHTVSFQQVHGANAPGVAGLLDYAVVTVDRESSPPPTQPQPPPQGTTLHITTTTTTTGGPTPGSTNDQGHSLSSPVSDHSSNIASGLTKSASSNRASTGSDFSQTLVHDSSSLASPNNSGVPTTLSSHRARAKTIPLVGGIVAAIILLVLLAALVYCLKRRKQRSASTVPPITRYDKHLATTYGQPLSQLPTPAPSSKGMFTPEDDTPVRVPSPGLTEPMPRATDPERAETAPDRDVELERRLRVLEEMVQGQAPPAYT
ncbi:hypothetical protein MIND_00149200 [Mycena indigotica]|uniref:Uncharacterized protein n=1 Tax=Mycena indigotica TaxID=2126181 RepID=A0A8H6TF03_9AGAR|nr:uncharacterized protein MIND_00149200 [Mycena indigotica]KAF7316305.1 hypothetical protein MIND_00149200 [Mycena indigotica]